MAKRKRVDEGLDNEGPAPKYDVKSEREAGIAAAETQAKNPNFAPVPGGGVFIKDPEMDARAAEAKAEAEITPRFDPDDGPPSPVQFAAAKEAMRSKVEYPPVSVPAPALAEKFLLVQDYGGRFRAFGFSNFEFMQGYVQNLPGTKRLFREIPGQPEFQEIRGSGAAVHRS